MGSGQVAADTITSAAGSTGTGITMTMVITLNQQPATSYQLLATTPSSTRDGRAGRRNNKIKLVGKVSQITVKRVGWLLLVLVYLFTIDHDRYWQSCETGGGEEEQCPAPHPAWWCGPASTHQPPQLGH